MRPPASAKTGRAERAEHAALAGEERLLSAGVGGARRAQLGRRVPGRDRVEEQQGGIAGLADDLRDGAKESDRRDPARRLAARVAQRVVAAAARGFEQRIAHAHGETGAAQRVRLPGSLHEREDVRMRVGQDHEVRALPAPRKGVDARRVGDQLGEGDGPRRDAPRAPDGGPARAEPGEVDADAAGALLDARGPPQGLVDRVEGVARLEHEARGELASRASARVREDGHARPEAPVAQRAREALGPGRARAGGLRLGDGPADPIRHCAQPRLARRGDARTEQCRPGGLGLAAALRAHRATRRPPPCARRPSFRRARHVASGWAFTTSALRAQPRRATATPSSSA